jgi:thiamine biosynthesis lipoprotein
MTDPAPPPPESSATRRDLLTGAALQRWIAASQQRLAELASHDPQEPTSGPTVHLTHTAMACDFDVILNPGPAAQLEAASTALDLVDRLEDQLSVYRPTSELSRLNATAADGPVVVESQLFDLLMQADSLAAETGGAFDATSGPLVRLWRECRAAGRVPTREEVAAARARVGRGHVEFDPESESIRFLQPGVEFNLGSIGKGYAIDRCAQVLADEGVRDVLIHGGTSSVRAMGRHASGPGWPVGLRNPLFPDRRWGMVRLCDRSMSTTGSGVQSFRVEGRRYGHVLDPRNGWPVEGMLSCTVLAPTAALADALSTAFFVLGVENASQYCHNRREITAIVIPAPTSGARLEPIVLGPTDGLWLQFDDGAINDDV